VKLALGTVQFGMPYGIANQEGKVGPDEIARILAFARETGISILDTAIAYGDSEASLGAAGVADLCVITKLPSVPEGEAVVPWIRAQVQASLHRLGVRTVYGLLLHRPEQLAGVHGAVIADALAALKAEGLVQKVGVSIYAPAELDTVWPTLTIDIVQAPFNLIDRRLVNSGWLRRLHEAGVEVHVRSLFMQGLLLLPRADIPAKFEAWTPLWDAWHAWLRSTDMSAVEACIAFVQFFPQIDKLVVGVDNVRQLEQLAAATRHCRMATWPAIESTDERLINPSQWSSL